jgi:hypothetical protein
MDLEIKRYLQRDVERFVPVAMAQVQRNVHMHRYRFDAPEWPGPDPEALKKWLFSFVNKFTDEYKGSTVMREFIGGLIRAAREFRSTIDSTPLGSNQDLCDALLVGFLNEICGRRGIDLALYAADLA